MSRARNRDGTFKSAFDAALERDEAEWHAKIKAKMDAGMSFDDAWVAAGGSIISDEDLRRERDMVVLSRRLAKIRGGAS